MRRLAAASAMWAALAALVIERVSAMRMKSAREARSGRMARILREKPLRGHHAGAVAAERQWLAGQLRGEELGAQRSPQQAAGAQAGGEVQAFLRTGAEDREPVRHRGAEARPALQR